MEQVFVKGHNELMFTLLSQKRLYTLEFITETYNKNKVERKIKLHLEHVKFRAWHYEAEVELKNIQPTKYIKTRSNRSTLESSSFFTLVRTATYCRQSASILMFCSSYLVKTQTMYIFEFIDHLFCDTRAAKR